MLKIADHYCPACGERREDLVRDDEVIPCPSCDKPMKRSLTYPTFFHKTYDVKKGATSIRYEKI